MRSQIKFYEAVNNIRCVILSNAGALFPLNAFTFNGGAETRKAKYGGSLNPAKRTRISCQSNERGEVFL